MENALICVRDGQREGIEDLVLFTYHKTAGFRRAKEWLWIEKVSRGLIFEKETGKLIARPFYKFYNYGELEEDKDIITTDINELFYKHDGSLGICFYYNDLWWVTTYGSLNSEQGQYATELLRSYNYNDLYIDTTYMTEIIYPENRIVSNYDQFRGLIYLGKHRIDNTSTFSTEEKSVFSDYDDKLTTFFMFMEDTNSTYGVDTILKFCKINADYNYEGFVLKLGTKRVKFKTDAYLAVHRAKFDVTPKRVKEMMMDAPSVLLEYKESLPNEFFGEIDEMIAIFNEYVMEKMALVNHFYQEMIEVYGNDLVDKPAKEIGKLIHREVNSLPEEIRAAVWMKFKNEDYQKIYNCILKTH